MDPGMKGEGEEGALYMIESQDINLYPGCPENAVVVTRCYSSAVGKYKILDDYWRDNPSIACIHVKKKKNTWAWIHC